MPRLRLLALTILALTLLSASALADEKPPRLIGRVTVGEDGFYRVSARSLTALGAQDSAYVELRRRGRSLSCLHEGGLVFLALDVADDHSRTSTYELWLHDGPVVGRLINVDRTAMPGLPTGLKPLPRGVTLDRVFGELASAHLDVYAQKAPTWFLAPIQRGAGTVVELGPMGAAPGTPQELQATVYVAHRGAVAVKAKWGEHDLGEARVEGAVGGAVLTWTVPTDKLPAAPASLQLWDRSPEIPAAPPKDVSHGRGTVWVDAVALRGPARPRLAGSRLLGWQIDVPRGIAFPGDTAVYATIVAPDGAIGVPGVGRTYAWGRVPTGSRLYAAAEARAVDAVAATQPPHPLATAGDARHVILAVPPLVEPAQALATHRSTTGTPSAVVPVTDVYAHYGHGEAKPTAIRAFVVDLMKRGRAPLDFLLLAGDATFDRTDLLQAVTIPTPMSRSMYNGPTSADRAYVLPEDGSFTGGPSIGRLPFRKAETLRAYVDRVIRYETDPPADASRRMLRFVTSEGRFGAYLDSRIERVFRNVITNEISSAFDIEVTFASQTSAFLWPPPEFNDKVIDDLNAGSLFFTYVGHGFARGFDNLYVGDQQHRILHVRDVPRVDVQGTPPAVFVLACTTALFDGLSDGVGEALMKQPRGPIAYWGATRVCHPAFNTLMGRAVARFMTKRGDTVVPPRLGQVIDRARDEVLAPESMSVEDMLLRGGITAFAGRGVKLDVLNQEGAAMYVLLGDPALKVAQPCEDLRVEARVDEATGEVLATILGDLPAGTTVKVSLELPRNRDAADPKPVPNPTDPASYDAIRRKHDAMNDWALVRRELQTSAEATEVRFPLGERKAKGLIVKAWAVAGGDVHHGAAVLR